IIMHDVERIAGLPHVQPGKRTPRAAHRIECAARAFLQHVETVERMLDDLLRLLQRLAGDILQGQSAQRQRDARSDARAVNVDQFERTAAEIADNAVRTVNTGNDAERSQVSFPPARKYFDARATNPLRLSDEGAAIPGVPTG